MKFIVLDPIKFEKFTTKSPFKTFTQTREIAELRKDDGWTNYYFGVEVDDELKAAAMLIAKPSFLGKSTFYCPGGPLLDYEDRPLVEFLFKKLKSFIKSHNGYVLHIDPYYELIERDRDGNIVENGFNHHKAIQNLQSLGFKSIQNSSQPKYLFVMDIKQRTPNEIFSELKRNTRNHVRKAEKHGVVVRELKKEELNKFKKITEATSERRKFKDKPLAYYEKMYDLFYDKGEVQFLVAEADGKLLSAAMFILYGDEIIYLFSGSDEKYMREYNAQYAIQWYMIKYASEHGFKKYNFYGINGLPDPNSPDYGIYEFKKGFGGHVVELLGSFELPINPFFYHLHSIFSKIKNLK